MTLRTAQRWHHVRVLATAYVVRRDPSGCDTYTNRTASGTRATRGTIAVDTDLIPFGTRVRVPGYGPGIARDTGGLIRGHRIDLAMLTCREALTWGARWVTIAIADSPRHVAITVR